MGKEEQELCLHIFLGWAKKTKKINIVSSKICRCRITPLHFSFTCPSIPSYVLVYSTWILNIIFNNSSLVGLVDLWEEQDFHLDVPEFLIFSFEYWNQYNKIVFTMTRHYYFLCYLLSPSSHKIEMNRALIPTLSFE